jgi:hypothetical protein
MPSFITGIFLLGLMALHAVAVDSTASEASDSTAARTDSVSTKDGVTYLVPELRENGYRISNDKQRFKNRVSFSPGYGEFGNQDFFDFRLGYSPNLWLGYEISLGHNPSSGLHAMLHTFNVILRYPIPWRLQPYVSLGYGMMTVFPGEAINADPVSKNTLVAGGGLEFYVRDDVALRGEIRGATVLGQELNQEGTVAYSYRVYTIGFSFYRSLGR